MKKISRRNFIRNTSGLAAVSLGGFPPLYGMEPMGSQSLEFDQRRHDQIPLRWLGEKKPAYLFGTTFGVPWSPGETRADDRFVVSNGDKTGIPVQTWPLAFWPDGSVKWSAHAIGSSLNHVDSTQAIFLEKTEARPESGIQIQDNEQAIEIDNGIVHVRFPKQGSTLIDALSISGHLVGGGVVSQLVVQDGPDTDGLETIHKKRWEGRITQALVENKGSERVVVKIEGVHTDGENDRFPFILRVYIYRDSASVRLVHTFIYDGEENRDFIKGIGLSFGVQLGDATTYNRHVRYVGDDGRLFAESVRGLTGLRRDPGEAVRNAQVNGQEIQLDEIGERVRKGLPYIPEFGDYTLTQLNHNGYTIRKRTASGHSWLHAVEGTRALGTAYLGSPRGGLAIGVKNFWQSYPAQLDISRATQEEGRLTAWLWAPQATAMDLRFYHDGLGQDTYEKQWEGLEITYEDYEEGYATPYGVARTSELLLTAFAHTPDDTYLSALAKEAHEPSFLTVYPEYLFEKQVFGGNWSLPKRDTTALSRIEDQLDAVFTFYHGEVDRRGWYGFWNYGDVMHAYDEDRRTWRYDIGGYAWDNSELSTDLWLWYYYLRTGKEQAFRFAEAMCRHTGEVDVYHKGHFAPLGTRHNVMHWGCSAKQLRISTAINRRIYYYLTGDERTGDLLDEQIEAARRLEDVIPLRKRLSEPVKEEPGKVLLGFGTDWGAVAAAWYTAWERSLDTSLLERLKTSMKTIAQQPQGFFTGGAYFQVDTGAFDRADTKEVSVSHLNSLFGLVEINQEMIEVISEKEFKDAWLTYCRLYNAPAEERERVLGTQEGRFNLRSSHARLSAYAAVKLGDPELARRAWKEFLDDDPVNLEALVTLRAGPEKNGGLVEWKGISTNWAAQWSLNAIQLLHYVGDKI